MHKDANGKQQIYLCIAYSENQIAVNQATGSAAFLNLLCRPFRICARKFMT